MLKTIQKILTIFLLMVSFKLTIACKSENLTNAGDTREGEFRETSLLRCIVDRLCFQENSHSTTLKISDFSPSTGAIGTILTINGENFSEVVTENQIKIGSRSLTILSASTTQLKAKILSLPANETRKISVTVGTNSVSSESIFTYIPTFYFATNGGGLSISRDGGSTYSTITTANGIGSNTVYDVKAIDEKVYLGTSGGLSVSFDGGNTFINYTTANGLSSNGITSLVSDGTAIYACMPAFGVAISTNGTSFSNYTTAQGLGSNNTNSITSDFSKIYVSTNSGLSISTNGGSAYTNYTAGLGSLTVFGAATGFGKLFVATTGGLSISTDGGLNYTNYTTAIGLGSNILRDIFIHNEIIYVANGNGLSRSTDGGTSFSNTNSLPNMAVGSVSAYENYVIGATASGIGISRDSGSTYTTYTSAEGLGNTDVNRAFIQ